jgi:hypothetical protein
LELTPLLSENREAFDVAVELEPYAGEVWGRTELIFKRFLPHHVGVRIFTLHDAVHASLQVIRKEWDRRDFKESTLKFNAKTASDGKQAAIDEFKSDCGISKLAISEQLQNPAEKEHLGVDSMHVDDLETLIAMSDMSVPPTNEALTTDSKLKSASLEELDGSFNISTLTRVCLGYTETIYSYPTPHSSRKETDSSPRSLGKREPVSEGDAYIDIEKPKPPHKKMRLD